MKIPQEKIVFFQDNLLKWFEQSGRHFKWRNKSANNYERIISEVLLQRTRATTVANYFNTFLNAYPNWRSLGNASEEDLQEILRPLGLYKQRANRLYKFAQAMKKRNGVFPKDRSEFEKMPMVGQYIANAYELFILKKPKPLLDVNMARVLERFFGPRKLADIRHDPYLQKLASNAVNHEKTKELNWGILDFGAKICIARNPKCKNCFLKRECDYFIRLYSE